MPGPKFFVALFLFLFFAFINHLVPWIEGKLTWGQFDIQQFNFHIWLLVVFAAGNFFLDFAKTAMLKFRSALDVSRLEYETLTYQFVTYSSRIGWLITLAAALAAVFDLFQGIPLYMQSGASLITFVISATFMYAFVFGFFFNIFRQFAMIVRLYASITRINIFHLNPLYAFSGFTYRLSVFLILAGALSYVTNVVLSQEDPQVGPFVFFSSVNLAMAVGAFILPLGGIHARLEKEKELISRDNDERINKAYKELHRRVDKKGLKDMVAFRNQVSALLDYRHEIERISTWPWEPGTLRNFITALFVPLTVWAIQQFFTRVVGN